MSEEDEDAFEDALDDVTPRQETLNRQHANNGAASARILPMYLDLKPMEMAQRPHSASGYCRLDGRQGQSHSPLLPSAPSAMTPGQIGLNGTPFTPSKALLPGMTPFSDITASARHERLAALRRRMRDEFGHARFPVSSTGDTDSQSVASDATSLHSWHHHLLGAPAAAAPVVRPVDSISTCAGGVPATETRRFSGQFSPLPSSPPPAVPPPPRPTPRTTAPPPPLPPRNPSIRLPDPVAMEVLSRIAAAEASRQREWEAQENKRLREEEDDEVSVEVEEQTQYEMRWTAEPSSSKATVTSPPLSKEVEKTSSGSIPIPVPRVTAATNNALHTANGHAHSPSSLTSPNSTTHSAPLLSPNPRLATAASITQRTSQSSNDSICLAEMSTPVGGSGSSLIMMNLHHQHLQGQDTSNASSCSSPLAKNNSCGPAQITVVTVTGERRRGHAKTNSLDRGLTLAKSIKTGPFPPPSSKSNSLTRQQPPIGGDSEGEEEERNTLAEGVIEQLTTSVIGEETVRVATAEDDKVERPSQLGPIPSCSSSSDTSSRSSKEDASKTRKNTKQQQQHERKKSRDERRIGDATTKQLASVKESPEHTLPVPASSAPALSSSPISRTPSASSPRILLTPPPFLPGSKSASLPAGTPAPGASMDPITRDVERRMSMKGHHGQNAAELASDDGRSEAAASTVASSLVHARAAVRVYGHTAGGFIRGVFSRAKSAFQSGTSSSRGTAAESELSCGSDDDSDSEGRHSLPPDLNVSGGASATGTMTSSVAGASGGANGKTAAAAVAAGGGLLNTQIVRPKNAKKGPFDFEHLRVVQVLSSEHSGAVWCVRFSVCGRLMATAGQDSSIRVWCARSHVKYFGDMRDRYQQKRADASASSTVSGADFDRTLAEFESDGASPFRPPSSSDAGESISGGSSNPAFEDEMSVFANKPFAIFKGHTADVLDLSWSKNYFILSSGMDRTVKLWHLSRSECLCCFQHVDFVTCVAFLPKDDRYFLSGSLDGKLRLWHIPDKKVAVWNEVAVKFITALTFAKSGKFAVVGTYNGRCYFYSTDQLKYYTVIDVRSTRGKNARGHKVTGLAVHGDKLLVTSNDSRIRMYDVRDKALTCKFKGAQTEKSQIRASFSPDGKHIVSGSEDRYVYIWRTSELPSSLSVRKDRNAQWERARAHQAPVTVACFAPKPAVFLAILDRIECARRRPKETPDAYRTKWQEAPTPSTASSPQGMLQGDLVVSADLSGCIKVMVNRAKATKTGQSTFFSASREI